MISNFQVFILDIAMIIKHVLATVQSQIRGAVTFSANGFL